MILVKAYFSTDENGVWVYDDVEDQEDLPICFYGPFDCMASAEAWMNDDYPDGDEDLYEMIADDFDFPKGKEPFINAPDSIFGDNPGRDVQWNYLQVSC